MVSSKCRTCRTSPKMEGKPHPVSLVSAKVVQIDVGPVRTANWPVCEEILNNRLIGLMPEKRLRRSMQRADLRPVADYSVGADQQARSRRHTASWSQGLCSCIALSAHFLPEKCQWSGSLPSFHPVHPLQPKLQQLRANLFSFVPSMYLSPLSCYSKWQEETRPRLQHFAENSPRLSIQVLVLKKQSATPLSPLHLFFL